ncbi:MAG: cysteine--tRNA ligase [Bacteroidetes bacterium]|nr:cysteine--tRNA ligase [Bacteroidota bacterium]
MAEHQLLVYNTLSRSKEVFQPLNPPHVGLYVCGPTVYGEAHLGHARPYVTFDILNRYLTHLGYKVRYVRNITDVGHLENDADEGEDKIAKKARLEQLEPMEVVELYTGSFHESMRMLNNLPPGIEPRASGHIPEQIEMVEKIINNGFAYEANGSVYFDVISYSKNNDYGKLSGRVIEELIAGAGNERRELKEQDEKRNPADFALWKKADSRHIMRWKSPWGEGFPGWHIECSAMSSKYLGETFDIHGGGMDLVFPHHESEIAQSKGSCGKAPVRYWMHNNMITINGRKMGKSLGNFITLKEFFDGSNALLDQAYSPMTIRFFILQAHYRSTLDFSNDALKAAEKAYIKIINGLRSLNQIEAPESNEGSDEALQKRIDDAVKQLFEGMNDDLNTAVSMAALFDLLKIINSIKGGQILPEQIGASAWSKLASHYRLFVNDIFGLLEEKGKSGNLMNNLMEVILQDYSDAKARKDYATVDRIRAQVKKEGVVIKDSKTGISWDYEE